MLTKEEKMETMLGEMKTLALLIQNTKLKRQAYALGLEKEYVSMNEQKRLEREFAIIARKHKRLYFSQ